MYIFKNIKNWLGTDSSFGYVAHIFKPYEEDGLFASLIRDQGYLNIFKELLFMWRRICHKAEWYLKVAIMFMEDV